MTGVIPACADSPHPDDAARTEGPSAARLARIAITTEEGGDETRTGSHGNNGAGSDADWRHGDLAEPGAREDGFDDAAGGQGNPGSGAARASAHRPEGKRKSTGHARDDRGEGR